MEVDPLGKQLGLTPFVTFVITNVTLYITCPLTGMAQGLLQMRGVQLEADHEDLQRVQQDALLQHVSSRTVNPLVIDLLSLV